MSAAFAAFHTGSDDIHSRGGGPGTSLVAYSLCSVIGSTSTTPAVLRQSIQEHSSDNANPCYTQIFSLLHFCKLLFVEFVAMTTKSMHICLGALNQPGGLSSSYSMI